MLVGSVSPKPITIRQFSLFLRPQFKRPAAYLPCLPILAVLGLSYLPRAKTQPARVSFIAWCISLQFFIIGMLGVGLIHTHFDCPYLLGDCYVEGYPRWPEHIQIALVFYVFGWWSAAAIQFLFNVYKAIFKRLQGEIINPGRKIAYIPGWDICFSKNASMAPENTSSANSNPTAVGV